MGRLRSELCIRYRNRSFTINYIPLIETLQNLKYEYTFTSNKMGNLKRIFNIAKGTIIEKLSFL